MFFGSQHRVPSGVSSEKYLREGGMTTKSHKSHVFILKSLDFILQVMQSHGQLLSYRKLQIACYWCSGLRFQVNTYCVTLETKEVNKVTQVAMLIPGDTNI